MELHVLPLSLTLLSLHCTQPLKLLLPLAVAVQVRVFWGGVLQELTVLLSSSEHFSLREPVGALLADVFSYFKVRLHSVAKALMKSLPQHFSFREPVGALLGDVFSYFKVEACSTPVGQALLRNPCSNTVLLSTSEHVSVRGPAGSLRADASSLIQVCWHTSVAQALLKPLPLHSNHLF